MDEQEVVGLLGFALALNRLANENTSVFFVEVSCSLCRGDEDVRSVLTLIRRGAAQVCHVLRVEELREQLEEEEEDGDRQEEEEEVESGEVESKRTHHEDDHGWR